MRGFGRNVRGGSKFILANFELRAPLVAYLYKKPIKALFWRNLIFTVFSDVGTAWTESSPYDDANPFNTVIVDKPSYHITVVSQRNPWVYSFGYGLRTKFLGYYLKFDRAKGFIENKSGKFENIFSLGLDF
jgi:hypothetical protein